MFKSRNQIWAQSGQGQSQTQACPACDYQAIPEPTHGDKNRREGENQTSGFAARPLGTVMLGLGHTVGMCGGHPSQMLLF